MIALEYFAGWNFTFFEELAVLAIFGGILGVPAAVVSLIYGLTKGEWLPFKLSVAVLVLSVVLVFVGF